MELKQVHTTPNYNIPPRVSPSRQDSTLSLYFAPVGLRLAMPPGGTSTTYFFFLTCSIQFLSRHWLRVQLCLCSQSTVSGIHSLAQLQGWLQPHALLLEPAQTGSCRQQLKCWDTGGSPAFLTEEPPHTPEEEQVVKTPIQSLTTIPIKTAIQEKRPENSACMQEGRFAFHKQMCSGQCLDGPCKERVYPGWNTGSTPGGLRQMQG